MKKSHSGSIKIGEHPTAAWMLAGTVLVMFDAFSGTSASLVEIIFATPLAVNEMVLALQLIVKGFDRTGVSPEADNTVTSPARSA
jgi:hypothetical protein